MYLRRRAHGSYRIHGSCLEYIPATGPQPYENPVRLLISLTITADVMVWNTVGDRTSDVTRKPHRPRRFLLFIRRGSLYRKSEVKSGLIYN